MVSPKIKMADIIESLINQNWRDVKENMSREPNIKNIKVSESKWQYKGLDLKVGSKIIAHITSDGELVSVRNKNMRKETNDHVLEILKPLIKGVKAGDVIKDARLNQLSFCKSNKTVSKIYSH